VPVITCVRYGRCCSVQHRHLYGCELDNYEYFCHKPVSVFSEKHRTRYWSLFSMRRYTHSYVVFLKKQVPMRFIFICRQNGENHTDEKAHRGPVGHSYCNGYALCALNIVCCSESLHGPLVGINMVVGIDRYLISCFFTRFIRSKMSICLLRCNANE
jgi:hypothetical protein